MSDARTPQEQLANYIRACFPYVYMVGWEEKIIQKDLYEVSTARSKKLYTWSITTGLTCVETGETKPIIDPFELFAEIPKLKSAVIALCDFHPFLGYGGPPVPALVRSLRDLIDKLIQRKCTMVFYGPSLNIPFELSKNVSVIEYALPSKEQLETPVKNIFSGGQARYKLTDLTPADINALTDAACGMTTFEAENATALSLVETEQLSAKVIQREKTQTIRKSGLLDIWENVGSLEDVGGLHNLKKWLNQRKRAFTEDAKKFNLPTPKGILIVGLPGTGKSLIAKACAAAWGRPLLRLDAGKIFGGLVGESEKNMREIIQLSEAVAPVCLLVDEIEKAFASGASGSSDGGTSARVFGSLLTWMEEKSSPVFIVATANDVSNLPPELLRKGRFDELWWVDLPQEIDRQEILKIHLSKRNRIPKKFDLRKIAETTKDFSGAELEAVVNSALYAAFDEGTELTTQHLIDATGDIKPLAEVAREKIERLRTWSVGRTRNASILEKQTVAASVRDIG